MLSTWNILYEMEGVSEEIAREALRWLAHKLSVNTKFIARGEQN
jgi:ribosomal protein L16/L10AE